MNISFESLHKMFEYLKVDQIKYIDYSLMKTVESDVEKPMYTMFQLLSMNEIKLNDTQVCQKIYQKNYCSAYSQLKSRMYRLIIHAILIGDAKVMTRNKAFNERFDLVKEMIVAEFLIRKGDANIAISILEKLLEQALTKEYIVELVLINNLLVIVRSRDENFGRLENLYKRSGDILKDFFKYTSIYNQSAKLRSVVHSVKSQKVINEKIKEVEDNLSNLKIDENESMFFVNKNREMQLQLSIYSNKNEYEKALQIADDLLILYQNNYNKVDNNDFFGLYIEKSICLLNLFMYDECIESCNEALKYSSSKANELAVFETQFLAYFRKGNYTQANDVLEAAFSNTNLAKMATMNAKFHFYKACFFYKDKNYDQVNKHMRKAELLYADTKGWEIAFKLLDIMIFIDNKDFYYLKFYLEKVRKMLTKMKDENTVRLKEILKISSSVAKHNGNKKLVLKDIENSLNKLSEGKSDFYWNPKGYEFFRFDEWINGKLIE